MSGALADGASGVRAPRPWRAIGLGAVALVLLALCARWLEFEPAKLFGREGVDALVGWFARFRTPDVTPDALRNAATGAGQTLAIAFVGTLAGSVIGFALMAFSCRTLLVRGPLVDEEPAAPLVRSARLAAHHAARLVANALRTVPYLVWAILFILTVGLGPFPGALAIGLHTGGVLARLFSTALDEVDPRSLVALRSSGATAFGVFLFGMLPSAKPALLSYALYRFEVNVREAAVLGVVGAGGLGLHLKLALDRFDFAALATYLLAIMALVLLVDAVSAQVRKRAL